MKKILAVKIEFPTVRGMSYLITVCYESTLGVQCAYAYGSEISHEAVWQVANNGEVMTYQRCKELFPEHTINRS